MFSRITIEEKGESSAEDILVLRWRNVRKFLSVRGQTFYIWTVEDLNTMDLDTNLFRCRERLSKINKVEGLVGTKANNKKTKRKRSHY